MNRRDEYQIILYLCLIRTFSSIRFEMVIDLTS
jgi:hypothetical protein